MRHSVALNFADGKTFFIDAQDNELLLNAAVRQGITLPLDCREGVCGTCQGLCENGRYEQDYVDEDALSDLDVAQGKILACQTRVHSNASFYFDHDAAFCQAASVQKTQAQVQRITWLTADTVLLQLKSEQQNLHFLAGQYARIYLPNCNEYRAYSFAHAANDRGELQFLIRYLPDGLMGHYLKHDCQVGQTLTLDLPYGSFYLRQHHPQRPLYFMAGGTGLSAILAMLDQCRELQDLPDIYLYYAVRNEEDLCEQERIAAYQAEFNNLHYVPVLSRPSATWQGASGYIQQHLVSANLMAGFDMYVCGPPALVDALQDFIHTEQLTQGKFYSEKFVATQISQAV